MSNMPAVDISLDSRVRTMQIIKFALIMGVTAFAGIVVVNGARPGAPNQPIWLILAIFGGTTLLARLIVPSLIVRSSMQRIASGNWRPANPGIHAPTTDEGRLAVVYQNQMIFGSALLEGGAFANLVSCQSTGHIVSWIISGILWLGLVVDFPTRTSVERWIAAKMQQIRDERTFSSRHAPP